ncbi:MAG: hypothetical protein H7288_15700 [Kineosporiaceae bacterium]|nr:hypothetical protein [Aeromicrobium sp.]
MDQMTLQEVRSPEHSTAGLEVTRLDRTSWCISNSFINEGDSGRLLGYIEGLERDRYEVLWIAAPISWAYVNSFELALAALADRLQFSGIVEPERDPAARASSIALFHPVRRR